MKDRGRLCGSNSFIWILPLLSQLTVTTEKLWGKKNGTKQSSKNGSIELREKNNKQTKKKPWQNGNQILNQQIAKMWVVKVVKNYLIIVTVIIAIIMKMIAMLINKDNNK